MPTTTVMAGHAGKGTGCFSHLREKMPVPGTPLAGREAGGGASTARPGKEGQAPFREAAKRSQPLFSPAMPGHEGSNEANKGDRPCPQPS